MGDCHCCIAQTSFSDHLFCPQLYSVHDLCLCTAIFALKDKCQLSLLLYFWEFPFKFKFWIGQPCKMSGFYSCEHGRWMEHSDYPTISVVVHWVSQFPNDSRFSLCYFHHHIMLIHIVLFYEHPANSGCACACVHVHSYHVGVCTIWFHL